MIEIPAQGCAYFASDLHLSTGTPKTLEAFESWISQIAQPGNMIFLLGDVFEVWVGDDHEDEVTQRVAKATRNAGNCGAAVYFMHGNRDFVMGDDYPALAGFEVLADPEFLLADGKPILITHGDQLCTDDKPYQKFRLESRTHHWMEHFLGKSLDERLKLAQHMRLQSQMHKSVHNPDMAGWITQGPKQRDYSWPHPQVCHTPTPGRRHSNTKPIRQTSGRLAHCITRLELRRSRPQCTKRWFFKN